MFLYFRNTVTRFVILFEGRTGSSYLVSSLATHPRVRAEGEALVRLKDLGHDAQADWVRRTLAAPLLGKWGAIGFKTKLRDIADREQFAELLREQGVKIIHMQRRNRVKVAISEINCNVLYERTKQYNVYKKEDRLPAIRIEVPDFKEILSMRERLDEELKHFVDGLRLSVMNVFYEDLLLDEENTLNGIYQYLGVPSRMTKGASYKNTSDNLRDALLNFDELRASVAGTSYEKMFDEVLVRTPVK